MNKKYKEAFIGVAPDDKSVERIFDMTKTKTKRTRFKTLLVAAVVMGVLMGTLFTANAVTDGAVLDKAVSVIINGQKVTLDDENCKTVVSDSGNEYKIYHFDVTDEDGFAADIEFACEGDGDAAAIYRSDKNSVDFYNDVLDDDIDSSGSDAE